MTQEHSFLRIHPKDNALVALRDLEQGTPIEFEGQSFNLTDRVAAKHKFALNALHPDDSIFMYGVLVGKATKDIAQGGLLSTENIHHASSEFHLGKRKLDWHQPDTSKFAGRTFMGYHRADGSVGTANYWIVIPLVLCENRNIQVMKEALVDKLGYKKAKNYENEVEQLMNLYQAGKSTQEILNADILAGAEKSGNKRFFKNIDGIKFLTHDLGCGGTQQDSQALCGLLAGKITRPKVAGATVLSLGCQHAQAHILQEEIAKRDPDFKKPLVILEQQKMGTERNLLQEALKQTFAGLVEANQNERRSAPISKLCIGLECGGSDGFSGISANPALGYVSDLLVSIGGSVILSEFPELCGVEQELSDRCVDEDKANYFMSLMKTYNARAEADGSGFYANPSPGNIRDGLITDAIKSAGAAKKGGTSPVTDVLYLSH